MPSVPVVLNVYGGVVQAVFCSDPDIVIHLVDWDVTPDDPDAVHFHHQRRLHAALVARPNARPLHVLTGSDVEAAIEAAEQEPTYGKVPSP